MDDNNINDDHDHRSAAMSTSTIAATHAYPLELHYVKALFLQQQFRHTIRACQDLLASIAQDGEQRPLQKTFCSYYVAAAHDELARAMHRNSQATLPALTTAELFYIKALDALPSADEARSICEGIAARREASFVSRSTEMSTESANSTERFLASDASKSAILLSPTGDANDDTPADHLRSSSTSLPRFSATASDLDSHESFEQIRTPNRMLKRDYSRMSLLEPEMPAQSPTDGLHPSLRPDRATGPAKPYQWSHSLPDSSSALKRRSMLPKLLTHGRCDSGLPSAASSRWVTPEPVSPGLGTPEEPVSPLTPQDFMWETSNASPISPENPHDETPPWEAAPTTPDDVTPVPFRPSDEAASQQDPRDEFDFGHHESPAVDRLHEDIAAMRIQLQSHILLVREAKIQFQHSQSEKRPVRHPPTSGTPLVEIDKKQQSGEGKGSSVNPTPSATVPQARSYWSFTPVDVKAEEKKQRIRAGRERNWARPRFQPERYRELAERALGEL